MLQQTDCHVTLHYHRPGVLLLAPPPPLVIEFDSSPTTALSACWPHCVRLTPSTYWGLAPLEYWFFKNIRKTASSLRCWEFILCWQHLTDSGCVAKLMTVLACFDALPFFLSCGRILSLAFYPPFPPWRTSLEPVIFLLILCLGRGVHIFTRAAALKLFKSSDPRYIWLYLTQLGFEQAFFRNSSLNCFFAFWKALLAKIWCCEAHKHFIGPVMSVSHLLGGNAFRSVFTLVQAAHFKRPLSLDRHTSSFTSVFLLWKTPQVSPTL